MKLISSFTSIFALICLCAQSPLAHADVFLMKNGDRIQGLVSKAEGGFLFLKTPYSKKMKIKMSEVKKALVGKPVELHLKNGWKLIGGLRSTDDGKIEVRSAKDGKSTLIDWEQIKSINPKPDQWGGKMAFGGTTQTGNTDRSSLSLSGAWDRKIGARDRAHMSFLFNYAEEDSKATTRNTFGSGKYDHFFTSRQYFYMDLNLLNDKFKNLNLRTVVGPGLGYQIWDDNKKSLALEGGLAYFSEDLISGEDDQWATARLAGNYSLKFFGIFSFRNKLELFPNLNDFGKYTARNDASLYTELGAGWSLKFTNIFQFDSDPPTDIEDSDFTTIYSLQYAF